MDTRLAAQQIRLTEWAGIIHANNESGQTVKEFCRQNEITETQYFYWLRRVRAAALQDVFCKCKFPKVASKNGEICISVLEKVAGGAA